MQIQFASFALAAHHRFDDGSPEYPGSKKVLLQKCLELFHGHATETNQLSKDPGPKFFVVGYGQVHRLTLFESANRLFQKS